MSFTSAQKAPTQRCLLRPPWPKVVPLCPRKVTSTSSWSLYLIAFKALITFQNTLLNHVLITWPCHYKMSFTRAGICICLAYSCSHCSERNLSQNGHWGNMTIHFIFFFFETEFHCCYPDWSAMARSRLTTTSALRAQAILLPQPPE